LRNILLDNESVIKDMRKTAKKEATIFENKIKILETEISRLANTDVTDLEAIIENVSLRLRHKDA